MLRENLYSVNVTVNGTDGTTWSAIFDKMDGGDVTAKETKYRPANGTTDQVSLGGAREVSNIKVTRLYDSTIDPKVHWLLSQVGKGTMTVAKQPLDANGAPFGSALVYRGLLNAVNPPKTDSESDSPAMIELEQSSVTPIS